MTIVHHYRTHGLLFRSEVELPEFTPAQPGTPDITLRLAPDAQAARDALPEARKEQGGFIETENGAVLHIEGEADVLVRDGREIIVSLHPDCTLSMVRLYLIGSATGMALHQRGQLILHGAAIAHQHGVTVFVGHSGAGKSTLAANFGRMGHPVLSDDTLALHQTSSGFLAWPGSRVFKLWRDALEDMGQPVDDLQHITQRFEKFFLPNTSVAADTPRPIAEVIVLEQTKDDAPPELKPLQMLDALQRVSENAYRPEYVALLGREAPHFKQTAALVGAVPTYILRRPWDLQRMPEVIALIQSHWDAMSSRSESNA